MSISALELKSWINSLPDRCTIAIDDGGLTLQVVGSPEVYLEVGGMPEEEILSDDEDATVYCPACGREVKGDAQNRTSLADHGRCVDCQREWLDVGDKSYPRSDWQYEVTSGDTVLGYVEWVEHKIESES
jgi:hypothetical protein